MVVLASADLALAREQNGLCKKRHGYVTLLEQHF
jgi:hypothetical protein